MAVVAVDAKERFLALVAVQAAAEMVARETQTAEQMALMVWPIQEAAAAAALSRAQVSQR